jgi:hypothetical protein
MAEVLPELKQTGPKKKKKKHKKEVCYRRGLHFTVSLLNTLNIISPLYGW